MKTHKVFGLLLLIAATSRNRFNFSLGILIVTHLLSNFDERTKFIGHVAKHLSILHRMRLQ